MLPNVPNQISNASRNVTLRNPNSSACAVFRKVLMPRVGEGEFAEISTLGGIGVLSTEDESEFDLDFVGEGKILFTGVFPGSSMVERNDGTVPIPQPEALIESVAEPGTEDYFVPIRNDIVVVLIGENVRLPYEIADIASNVNIAPYTRRFILNPRDDLNFQDDNIEEGLGRTPQE